MRKCLRCDAEMTEDLTVMVTNGGYGIDVREKGMFKGSLRVPVRGDTRVIG